MKPVPQYQATVEQQHPATDGVANFTVVGIVHGTYEQCWLQARLHARFPVITFKELHYGTIQ
jgi:hypothetical protein